jgi:hypothetical protein
MRKQATHKGECQICGRTQKLPGERMAKHGYTVAWGFFSGVCQGSDNLPFELDCTLIAEAIRSAKVHEAHLVKAIADLKADTTPARARVTYWVRGDGYRSAWVPTDTIVEAEPGRRHGGQWVAPVTGDDGVVYEAALGYKAHRYGTAIAVEWVRGDGYRYGTATAVEAAYQANVQHATDIERRDLEGVQRYIAWQGKRLAGWTVQPLRTIATN